MICVVCALSLWCVWSIRFMSKWGVIRKHHCHLFLSDYRYFKYTINYLLRTRKVQMQACLCLNHFLHHGDNDLQFCSCMFLILKSNHHHTFSRIKSCFLCLVSCCRHLCSQCSVPCNHTLSWVSQQPSGLLLHFSHWISDENDSPRSQTWKMERPWWSKSYVGKHKIQLQ